MIFRFLFASTLVLFITLPAAAQTGEPAYDRVMKTQTIRCGYALAEPMLYRDMKNGGELKGFMVDITRELGKRLNLKIEWAEEVGWDQMATALETGRIDMACMAVYQSAARGRVMAFTRPLFYSAVHAYTRAGDARFDNAPDAINRKETRIVTLDDNVTSEIAQQLFPKASTVNLPMLSMPDQVMMNVVTEKSDIVFTEISFFNAWSKQNPGKLRQIPLSRPLRVYGNAWPVHIREQMLRDMIDTGLAEMMNMGVVESIMKPYMQDNPGAFLMPLEPYRSGQ